MNKLYGFLIIVAVYVLLTLAVIASCSRVEYVKPLRTNDIAVLKNELTECFADDGSGSMVEVNAEESIYPFLLYVHSNLVKAEKISPEDEDVQEFRRKFDELMDKYYIEKFD